MSVTPLFPARTKRTRGVHTITFRARRRLGCVDLTDLVEQTIARADIDEGACLVFSAHTTCAVIVNEWEDGALEDLARAIERLVPPSLYYAHDDLTRRTQNLHPDERSNGAAHVAHLLMGATSQVVPVTGGSLLLGEWQRIIAVELDEPRERKVYVVPLPVGGEEEPEAG